MIKFDLSAVCETVRFLLIDSYDYLAYITDLPRIYVTGPAMQPYPIWLVLNNDTETMKHFVTNLFHAIRQRQGKRSNRKCKRQCC